MIGIASHLLSKYLVLSPYVELWTLAEHVTLYGYEIEPARDWWKIYSR